MSLTVAEASRRSRARKAERLERYRAALEQISKHAPALGFGWAKDVHDIATHALRD